MSDPAQNDVPPSAEEERKAAQAIWDELENEETGAPAAEPAAPEEQPEPEAAAPREVEPQQTTPAGSPLSDEERALLRQIPEVMQLVKSTVGRVGSLQSELAKFGKQAAAHSTGEKPTATAIDKAASSPEKWEALKKDFPDWAEGVEAFVATRVPSAPSIDFDSEVGARLQKVREEDAEEMVSLFDPEWRTKVASEGFAKWMQSQSPDFQARVLNSWKPSEILSTLRAFDAHAKENLAGSPKRAEPQKNSRVANAAIPRPSSNTTTIAKPESEMSDDEYWAYLDKLDAQKARAAR